MSLLVERQFGCHLRLASVRVGYEAPRAIICPLYRPAQLACCVQGAEILRHVRLLHAEGATDSVSQDAHLVAADAEHASDIVPEPKDSLATDMKCEVLPCRIVFGEGGPRLDR